MDRFLRPLAVAIAAAALLATPGAAWAHKHIVHPGDPGSSQYQEDVPTAGGSQPVKTIGGGSTTPATNAVPRAVVRQLHHDGSDGSGTVSLAQSTAPSPPRHATRRQPLRYHSTAASTLVGQAVVGSGGGMGVLLPILLVLSVVAVIVLTVRRRS
jgi:hypothetical protein